jgi:HTH-type transcriptional regulator/antitoxin HigA
MTTRATIKPIKTESDYEAALTEIETLMEAKPDTPEGDRLAVLAALVSAYEEQAWPIEPPDPIAAIRYKMEIDGLKQSDLAELLGSRSRASEVLQRRRPLTLGMIRDLHAKWGIPAESLLKPYRLSKSASA